jgi:hypothetical protein
MDKTEHPCHRCGGTNHWARNCHTPKHFVGLYEQSLENKKKRVETNFANNNGDDTFGIATTSFEEHGRHDATHLDVSDFLAQE